MFTGLIEDVGTLARRTPQGGAAALEIATRLPLAEVRAGDSIAVNGACLTVERAEAGAGRLLFHALAETLERTSLGSLRPGAPVNLERALRLGDRLGGHLVTGHVDATAAIVALGRAGDDWVVTVALPAALRALVVPKGSIALDGISLTVARLTEESFAAHIIPHTWAHTNLAAARVGTAVNLEADLIGKYVLRRQEVAGAGLTPERLRDAGFGAAG